MSGRWRLAAGYAVILGALSVIHLLAPHRDGLIALSQIFAPHLFLPVLVLLPLALRYGDRAARTGLAAALVVGLLRFGPGMIALPQPGSGGAVHQIQVLSWNLAAGQVTSELLIERLLRSDAEVVGLQELRPIHAVAIEADSRVVERFPYRVLNAERTVLGIGLLSSHPIVSSIGSHSPAHVSATLSLPEGGRLAAITVHPQPARIGLLAGLIPIRYDASLRDEALRTIKQVADQALGRGEPLLLFGDFNVTDRERGYGDLAAGLSDAHRRVGLGPGSTWRPGVLAFMPFGILRIDYLFTAGGVHPLRLTTDCAVGAGDHCIIVGTIEVSP
jgi:vancomycin resistance protein VanJ